MKKPGAMRRASMFLEKGSVTSDDRRRRTEHVELVVYAEPRHDKGVAVVIATEPETATALIAADFIVERFGFDRPIRGEGVFKTTADGVTNAEAVPVVVVAEAAKERIEAVVVADVSERGAACGVDHEHRCDGVADTTASSAVEPAIVVVAAAAAKEAIIIVVIADIAAVLSVGFEAEHDRAGLPVVANLAAADEANLIIIVVVSETAAEQERVVAVIVVVHAERGAGIQTDVEA